MFLVMPAVDVSVIVISDGGAKESFVFRYLHG